MRGAEALARWRHPTEGVVGAMAFVPLLEGAGHIGVLTATILVFAEMLGSFAAAFVLGIPGRFFVVTTAIWETTLSFPPDYGSRRVLSPARLKVTITV